MIGNSHHNDRLDNYLLGKLSADEKAAMDAKLAADSQLQEDMLFQQDIVHALQEERRLELKNRLNSIEVGAGGFSSAIGLKIAAGVALVGLMGTAIYFYGSSDEPEAATELPVGIINFSDTDKPYTYSIPEMPAVTYTGTTVEKAEISQPREQSSVRPAAPVAIADVKAPISRKDKAVLPEAKNSNLKTDSQQNIQIQKPNVLSDFKDTEISASNHQPEAPVDALAQNRQFSTQSIEVSAQLHEKYDFHYQFYDNKLFIYGDFKSKPYEILEINTEGSRVYYLFFEKNYYGLKNDQQKLVRLKKISNEKLIKELEITRNQKMNPQHN
ncbi:hypothetical protein [Cesiribacter sp. SM1]|uniref:hypothetical protein n=1 Tax=Cesiribacter sp. SM1 TaxID=2861196 RepID=UPI001CD50DC6|nr:hypothetical protein [Cesiribacter sp. SM1]